MMYPTSTQVIELYHMIQETNNQNKGRAIKIHTIILILLGTHQLMPMSQHSLH